MEKRFLRADENCPIPLEEDFWQKFVLKNDKENLMEKEAQRAEVNEVTREVDRIMNANKEILRSEALKIVAPTAVNVVGNQFENLISLSFDQERLINNEEKKRQEKRNKAVKSVLRR
ncbi:unnamed protein product [Dracunculus medinensis]|uniref:BSD domain-containing protein n=1 Tax=Dracunculus medinensis TaxID=318479 RepID=A0A0N4UIG1_DRAME|nr:unnamed protein product [Dracunculus medinensis]